MKAARSIGAAAVRALYMELALEPKPGLVSFRDTGSHRDMDAGTFMRSVFALRHYFARIAEAGAAQAAFGELETLGLQAEQRMLSATRGINTHRGAVFALGLLCAAAGRLHATGQAFGAAALRATLRSTWGDALALRALRSRVAVPRSHGMRAAREHGLRSAGDEAAAAFPTLFGVTLPALQRASADGWPDRAARVQALFETIAALDDTNLVHRGGIEGLRFARTAARQFVERGGAGRRGWLGEARSIHDAFVARNLSPGGSADLLGCACWFVELASVRTGAAAGRPAAVVR